jgi:hypothetical protein
MRKSLFIIIYCLIFITNSCLKYDNSSSTPSGKIKPGSCEEFAKSRFRPIDTIECGQEIYISYDSCPAGTRYEWTGPTLINVPYDLNQLKLTNDANIFHRGWYYMRASYKNCPIKKDSIYINIKLNQGKPACNPSNNTSTYTGTGISINTKNFTSVRSSVSGNTFEIYAGGSSGGDFRLIFNEYWVKNKLESGIYYTTNDYSLSEKEDINKVYVEDRNFSQRWQTEEKKPVYISYVNGKLTVNICDLYIYDPSSSSFLNSRLNARLTVQ